jgi:hypothetical protein
MNLFITLLENVNKSRTSANNVSLKGSEILYANLPTVHYRKDNGFVDGNVVQQFVGGKVSISLVDVFNGKVELGTQAVYVHHRAGDEVL